MDIDNIKDKVHDLLGRPISCIEFNKGGKVKYLPLYLNFNTMKDASSFIGDTEAECYEKLYLDLIDKKEKLTH